MDTYPICHENKTVGTVTLVPEGNRIRAEARCRGTEQGVFRAFLLCRQGELPLGVLMPEGGELRLCRRIPLREIESRGGVCGAQVRLSYAFQESWQHLGGSRFHQYGGEGQSWEGAVWRREGERTLLALPFDPARPFPLVRLFCFARIMTVCRRRCAVFCFDKEDRPVMAEKES